MTQKLSNLPAFKQLVTLIKQEIAASKALTPQAKKTRKEDYLLEHRETYKTVSTRRPKT